MSYFPLFISWGKARLECTNERRISMGCDVDVRGSPSRRFHFELFVTGARDTRFLWLKNRSILKSMTIMMITVIIIHYIYDFAIGGASPVTEKNPCELEVSLQSFLGFLWERSLCAYIFGVFGNFGRLPHRCLVWQRTQLGIYTHYWGITAGEMCRINHLFHSEDVST